MSAPEMLAAARVYVGRGWPVFPLHAPTKFAGKTGPDRAECSCGDYGLDPGEHCANQGKHPRTRRGLYDASTDLDVVESWWTRWPTANIGLRTGVAFDAIDVDGPDAERVLDEHLAGLDVVEPINGPTAATGRGWHCYVAPTGVGNKTGVLVGVDWRGRGGYVVAPPSVHPLGRPYRWERPGDPVFGPRAPLQPAPAWVIELLDPPRPPPPSPTLPAHVRAGRRRDTSRYAQAALDAEVDRLAATGPGCRNDQLNVSAFALGQLVGAGALDPGLVIDRLFDAAQRAELGAGEAERTIVSGLRAGIVKPRGLPS